VVIVDVVDVVMVMIAINTSAAIVVGAITCDVALPKLLTRSITVKICVRPSD
jgi:hypothetical protein